tara:strand:- start:28 stop:597 length:570 start_codon:yes stop_codon:yes gene_type:complete
LFVKCLPNEIGHWFTKNGGDIKVEQNQHMSSGGFMDLVLYNKRKAIVVELKINHRENPFQYSNYRKHLEEEGYSAKAVGLLANKQVNRGLVDAVSNIVADARISWAWILDEMSKVRTKNEPLKKLREDLKKVYPEVNIGGWISIPYRNPKRSLALLETEKSTFGQFVTDLTEALPTHYEGVPNQAGNAI